VQNAIRQAIIKFEQDFMGRGPDEVRAFLVRDLVVVRLKGVLTPAERQLAKTVEGVEMVKRLRQNLIALGRDKLCEQVSEITGTKTIALFTDIDVQLGERVFVFTVDRDIQENGR
jgi:uncharacterized protein YbcI